MCVPVARADNRTLPYRDNTMTGDPGLHRLLFASRGKGRGHAMPDMAIAAELRARAPNVRVTFVSYSTGAIALRAHGEEVIDLGLSEDPSVWDAIHGYSRLFSEMKPRCVVSHEEFTV